MRPVAKSSEVVKTTVFTGGARGRACGEDRWKFLGYRVFSETFGVCLFFERSSEQQRKKQLFKSYEVPDI